MWDFPIILTQGGPDMKRKRYFRGTVNSTIPIAIPIHPCTELLRSHTPGSGGGEQLPPIKYSLFMRIAGKCNPQTPYNLVRQHRPPLSVPKA
jgi:hypothetical protein